MRNNLESIKQYHLFSLSVAIFIIALALDLFGMSNVGLRSASHTLLMLTVYTVSAILGWQMFQELRKGIWGVDILALAAILTSTILRQYWTAAIVTIMLLGGKALEVYAERRATSELSELLKRAPQQATLITGQNTIVVDANVIDKNNKILIKPGEVVPADCVIVEGFSNLDESSITGESLPVEKNKGDEILSGTVNIDGALTAVVLRAAKDSQYEQIIKLVKTATTSQAPFARLADKYTMPFSILSFGFAGIIWFITGDAQRFLEILVVATPCPLILGAPVGLISGMSRAARHGIIIKTGTALEKIATIKTLGFDKTGTLTRGEPEVNKILSLSKKYSDDQILQYAASIEQNSKHILAIALQKTAHQKKLELIKPQDLQEASGEGLSAKITGNYIQVGRLTYMNKQKVNLPTTFDHKTHETVIFVAVDRQLVGIITFFDKIRNETKQMLKRIGGLGISHTLIITGDTQRVAQRIAHELGVTEVVAECLPSEKVGVIHKIPKYSRPVGFVGDGINDAPVLAAADVGIALGARGSTAASESASIVIMQNNIERVADAIEIAKRTFFITKQTIVLGIIMSVGLMVIFATGRFKAAYGAAIQELVDVAVIINALRAHSDKIS